MASKSKNSKPEVAFRNKAVELGDDLRDMAGLAVDMGRDRLNRARSTATESYEGAKDRVMDWESTLEGYIQERPFKSLIVAAVVGMVFAKFWRRG